MNTQEQVESKDPKPQKRKWLRKLVLGIGLFGAVAVWGFREPLRARIAERAILMNDAPPLELVEEIIQNAGDPIRVIKEAWNSGKIVHRQVAAREIGRVLKPETVWPVELESILLAGALDPDMSVREFALGILRSRGHEAAAALAAAQLTDPDPQIRLLGLNTLKSAEARLGVPVVMPLLEEEDPFIVTMALKLLENWSG